MYLKKIFNLARFMYSRASLIWIIQLSGHMFGNQLKYPYRKRLTYPDFQLSRQLAWEWRCQD